MRSLEARAAEFEPARQFVAEHPAIDGVRINVGMPMEFDPRSGERPKPDGLEFTIPDDEDFSVLNHISEAYDRFDMRVKLTPYKQPNWTFENHRGDKRTLNEDADYDAFVRLVPDHR